MRSESTNPDRLIQENLLLELFQVTFLLRGNSARVRSFDFSSVLGLDNEYMRERLRLRAGCDLGMCSRYSGKGMNRVSRSLIQLIMAFETLPGAGPPSATGSAAVRFMT